MTVAKILEGKGHHTFTASSTTPLREVMVMLRRHGVGALVISDDEEHVVGIISERDLVRHLADQGPSAFEQPVAEVMTRDVLTCQPRDRASAVMAKMSERRVRHMPVIEDGKLAGMVSLGDVVKRRIDEIQAETDAMRDFITRS